MFQCLENLVIEKYGLNKWEYLKLEVNCTIQTGSWVRWENYPDSLISSLVSAADRLLGVKYSFGHYW